MCILMKPQNRILVIDDEAPIREVMTQVLERNGYHVKAVASGEVGLRLALVEKFDLVLLDLTMPDIHGLEVCRALHNDPMTSTLPIVIVSGNLTEQSRVESLRAGACDYLFKPFDLRTLLKTVRDRIAGESMANS